MGVDTGRVVHSEALEDALADLLCVFCSDLIDPHAASQAPCGHAYCTPCILHAIEIGSSFCPLDKTPVTKEQLRALKDANPLVYRLLGRTEVRCENFTHGCAWRGEQFDVPEHLTKCRTQAYHCECCQTSRDELRAAKQLIMGYERILEGREREVRTLTDRLAFSLRTLSHLPAASGTAMNGNNSTVVSACTVTSAVASASSATSSLASTMRPSAVGAGAGTGAGAGAGASTNAEGTGTPQAYSPLQLFPTPATPQRAAPPLYWAPPQESPAPSAPILGHSTAWGLRDSDAASAQADAAYSHTPSTVTQCPPGDLTVGSPLCRGAGWVGGGTLRKVTNTEDSAETQREGQSTGGGAQGQRAGAPPVYQGWRGTRAASDASPCAAVAPVSGLPGVGRAQGLNRAPLWADAMLPAGSLGAAGARGRLGMPGAAGEAPGIPAAVITPPPAGTPESAGTPGAPAAALAGARGEWQPVGVPGASVTLGMLSVPGAGASLGTLGTPGALRTGQERAAVGMPGSAGVHRAVGVPRAGGGSLAGAVGVGRGGQAGGPRAVGKQAWEGGIFSMTLHSHKAQITALAVSPDGNVLFSGSSDGGLRVWWGGQCRFSSGRYHEGSILSLAYGTDDVLFSCGEDKIVKAWVGAVGSTVRNTTRQFVTIEEGALHLLSPVPMRLSCIVDYCGRHKLVIAYSDGTVCLHDTAENLSGVDTGSHDKMDGPSVSEGATGERKGSGADVRIQLRGQKPELVLRDRSPCHSSLDLAASGSTIFFSGSPNHSIAMHTLGLGTHMLEGHSADVISLAAGCDGVLFSRSKDGVVKEWRSGSVVTYKDWHARGRLAVGPDGTVYCGQGTDGSVQCRRGGALVYTLKEDSTSKDEVVLVAIGRNGVLYSGERSGAIRVWQCPS